jgi:hypothetical protein
VLAQARRRAAHAGIDAGRDAGRTFKAPLALTGVSVTRAGDVSEQALVLVSFLFRAVR